MENKIKLAVDIGNTRVKFGIFENDQLPTIKKYKIDEIRNEIKSPEKLKKWILAQSDKQIEKLAFSISGKINHKKNKIIRSDVLGKEFNGCDFTSLFFSIPTKIYNDGISSTLSYIHIAEKKNLSYPCMCVSLGTGVAVSVIDLIGKDKYEVYSFEGWLNKVTIKTRKGVTKIWEALGKNAYEMIEKNDFDNRVIRCITALLNKYKKRFKWQPKVIYLNGGRAKNLNIKVIKKYHSAVDFEYSFNDDEQIKNLLRGIIQVKENIIISNE